MSIWKVTESMISNKIKQRKKKKKTHIANPIGPN